MQHDRAGCEIEAPVYDERSGHPVQLRLGRTVNWRQSRCYRRQ